MNRMELSGGVVLKIVRLVDTDEYKVEWWVDGVLDEGKSYYTNDLEDAQDTMAFMASRYSDGMGFRRYRRF